MATIYKIEIKTVSAFVNYPVAQVEKELKKFLEDRNKLNMESSKTKVTKK